MVTMAARSVDGTVDPDYASSGVTWRLTCRAAHALSPGGAGAEALGGQLANAKVDHRHAQPLEATAQLLRCFCLLTTARLRRRVGIRFARDALLGFDFDGPICFLMAAINRYKGSDL
jgi:hypothetical protein